LRFSITSRPALGPTLPPVQWVPGATSPRGKRQVREADHSHLVPPQETTYIYLLSPMHLHGAVLNELSSRIILPLHFTLKICYNLIVNSRLDMHTKLGGMFGEEDISCSSVLYCVKDAVNNDNCHSFDIRSRYIQNGRQRTCPKRNCLLRCIISLTHSRS
jgi:hypothetical protein